MRLNPRKAAVAAVLAVSAALGIAACASNAPAPARSAAPVVVGYQLTANTQSCFTALDDSIGETRRVMATVTVLNTFSTKDVCIVSGGRLQYVNTSDALRGFTAYPAYNKLEETIHQLDKFGSLDGFLDDVEQIALRHRVIVADNGDVYSLYSQQGSAWNRPAQYNTLLTHVNQIGYGASPSYRTYVAGAPLNSDYSRVTTPPTSSARGTFDRDASGHGVVKSSAPAAPAPTSATRVAPAATPKPAATPSPAAVASTKASAPAKVCTTTTNKAGKVVVTCK